MGRPELYTADSVAILGYLAEALPPKVDSIFRKVEDSKARLVVPAIALGETLFTLLKGRQVFGVQVGLEKLSLFLDTLELTRGMTVADLDIKGWKLVMNIQLPELHDRMIVATHLRMNSSAILTDDEEISSLSTVSVVWK